MEKGSTAWGHDSPGTLLGERVKRKDLGQHFLISRAVMERMCEYANLCKDDIVYEIGAGYGNFTVVIAEKVKKVYAIEIDQNLYNLLLENIKGFDNIVPILGDATIEEIPDDVNKVMGDLPYSISSIITEKTIKFLVEKRKDLAVFMYQKEFAERMIAKPGERRYSRLSFLCSYYCTVELLEIVPRHLFRPVPRVDSAIVRIVPKKGVAWDEELNEFVKVLFLHKKKKVINSLHDIGLSKELLREKVEKELLEKRVFKLTVEDILKLKEVLWEDVKEVIEKSKREH